MTLIADKESTLRLPLLVLRQLPIPLPSLLVKHRQVPLPETEHPS